MARALNDKFFRWLQNDPLNLLGTISQYDCLAIHFSNSNALKIYFKGFLILTISDRIMENSKTTFKVLSESYYTNKPNNNYIIEIITKGVHISNLQEYLDCVIGFLSRRNNLRAEEAVRQEIARINNLSREANDTDYFVVDEEYKINGPKFDLVTIRWSSDGEIRKHFNSKQSNLEIVIFELKQGPNAIGGTENSKSNQADLKKHISDFIAFTSDEELLSNFKQDIIRMFIQKASLKGFFNIEKINGIKHVRELSEPWNEEEIKEISNRIPVKFGLIISDYKQKSQRLKEQIAQTQSDFLFATSSFMGYGLYEKSMLHREQLLRILNEYYDSSGE